METNKIRNLILFSGSGSTPSRKENTYWNSRDIPWLKTDQIGDYKIYNTKEYVSKKAFDECSLKIYPAGAISMAMYGEGKTRGSVSILAAPMATNQACFTFVIDEEKINSKYVYYYLLNQYDNLRQLSSGVRKNLNADIIKNVEISYPKSRCQQDAIANVLGSIDDKILANRKIITTLESMAKTFYDYWFVQFDFPDVNGRPYKNSGGKMVWNEELGREIPAGWEVKPLCSFFTNERNGEWGTEKETKTNQLNVVCIRGADFPAANGIGDLSAPKRFISAKKADRIMKPGELIIEISGGSPTQSTGRVCYINQELIDRILMPVTTSNFCKIVSISDMNYFYFAYMTWKRLYEENVFFNFEGKTTGLKNLLFDVATTSIKVACPPIEVVKRYQNQAEKYFSRVQTLAKENYQLANLRDFLLPVLMNGQVTFRS